MNNYRAQVYPIKTENGSISWGAMFPDIDCVVGGGNSPEEAIKEAYENLDIYLQNNRTNLPQVTNSLVKEYSGRFVVRVSPKLHKDLAMCAERYGQSLNAICSEALARYVGEESLTKSIQHQTQIYIDEFKPVFMVGTYGIGRNNGSF